MQPPEWYKRKFVKWYPNDTIQHWIPVPAYDGDSDPAWLILTGGQFIYLMDSVHIEKYSLMDRRLL